MRRMFMTMVSIFADIVVVFGFCDFACTFLCLLLDLSGVTSASLSTRCRCVFLGDVALDSRKSVFSSCIPSRIHRCGLQPVIFSSREHQYIGTILLLASFSLMLSSSTLRITRHISVVLCGGHLSWLSSYFILNLSWFDVGGFLWFFLLVSCPISGRDSFSLLLVCFHDYIVWSRFHV
ncbi:hypothetical protein BJ165DRAFT_1494288 [Panaeolus papilionaceus]|nr:hypothetical protein BJ165DRAFT_1494288 [Panaeolus papilionaceus]